MVLDTRLYPPTLIGLYPGFFFCHFSWWLFQLRGCRSLPNCYCVYFLFSSSVLFDLEMSFSDAMSDPLLKFTAVASATLMAIGCVFMAVAELSAAPQEQALFARPVVQARTQTALFAETQAAAKPARGASILVIILVSVSWLSVHLFFATNSDRF